MTERENLDQITESIIGAAIEVHRALGPGLLESAYEACLTFECIISKIRGNVPKVSSKNWLCRSNLHPAGTLRDGVPKVEQQKPLPVVYREVKLDCGYRLDLLVEEAAVDRLIPIHQAQLLSYLKLSGCKVGLLINFNVRGLKDGIRRVANDFPDSLRSPRALR